MQFVGRIQLDQDFIVFSLDDKRPVIETHDWFYLSGNQFPRDWRSYLYAGSSSDENQYVVYSIFSGDKSD